MYIKRYDIGIQIFDVSNHLLRKLPLPKHRKALRRRMRTGRWPVAEPRSLEEIVALLKSEQPPVAAA